MQWYIRLMHGTILSIPLWFGVHAQCWCRFPWSDFLPHLHCFGCHRCVHSCAFLPALAPWWTRLWLSWRKKGTCACTCIIVCTLYCTVTIRSLFLPRSVWCRVATLTPRPLVGWVASSTSVGTSSIHTLCLVFVVRCMFSSRAVLIVKRRTEKEEFRTISLSQAIALMCVVVFFFSS